MTVFDTERGVTIDDAGIALFAKHQMDGDETGLTRDDWATAIQARADTLYEGRGMTKEGRFSKAIGGSARSERGTVVNDGDKTCKLYYQAMQHAPRSPAEKPEPPVDVAKAVAARAGTANEQMLELARARQKVFPTESDATAFVRV
jgi:hypothetical protein